jgi:hypothetical protein
MTDLHQPQFNDATIRQFLLGQLGGKDQVAFERALFCDSSLEQRTRLEEIALGDEYVTHKLRGKDLNAFSETFPFSAARLNQIEVSRALSECFARPDDIQRAEELPTFKHPAWKLAFATMILIVLFATIWLATKERRLAQRLIPHHIHPAATTPATPEVTHHAAHSSEPAAHRDQETITPGHELSSDTVVLDSTTGAENAPTVTLATIRDKGVHVQLLLGETAQSTYLTSVTKTSGEVVYSEAEIATDANSDRISFDLPIEHLAGEDLQIKLTRTSDGQQFIYFLRVR